MARENKQKRDEKRFGKSERLSDRVVSTPAEQWKIPWMIPESESRDMIRKLQADIERSRIIAADNVKDYFFENPKVDWVYKEDFPNSAPPFESFFIEASRPKRCVMGNRIEAPDDKRTPQSFGFLFDYLDAAGRKYPRSKTGAKVNDFQMVAMPGARWFARATPVFLVGGQLNFLSCLMFFAVSQDGSICENPSFATGNMASLGKDILDALNHEVAQFFMPCLLALSFINCRNTILEAANPDPNLNRERRKGGLKPFLRYHTINLEPMKKVLRTEGGVETNGLQKALHICRGHFATYSEDKPLFGHFTGTVWKPAHVRGSAKQGVVISDYNVKAPGPNV